jgi:hypothetical protein
MNTLVRGKFSWLRKAWRINLETSSQKVSAELNFPDCKRSLWDGDSNIQRSSFKGDYSGYPTHYPTVVSTTLIGGTPTYLPTYILHYKVTATSTRTHGNLPSGRRPSQWQEWEELQEFWHLLYTQIFSCRSIIQIYCSEKKEFIGTSQVGPLSTKRTRPFDTLWREHCITNLYAGGWFLPRSL